MADPDRRKSKSGRKRKKQFSVDEFGSTPDGGIAIMSPDGDVMSVTPASVAGPLRFLLARVATGTAIGLPARLAVTSAVHGEGVSFITRGLASLISSDTLTTVCVVDFNFTNPMQRENEPRVVGLADVVLGAANVADIVQPTKNPSLCFVRAGDAPLARRPMIIADPELAKALDTLSERFEHLILDLPPVLSSSQAINLAQLADAYLLVVRHGVTTENQIEAALTEMSGSEPLGVVLNRYRSSIPKRVRRLIGV